MNKDNFINKRFSIKKAISKIADAWDNIALSSKDFINNFSPENIIEDQQYLIRLMNDCVYSKAGDIVARRNTIKLGQLYLNLSPKGREKFFQSLAAEFDINRELFLEKIKLYSSEKSYEEKMLIEEEVKNILEAARIKILKQFNGLPQGMKFLVDMRADLCAIKKNNIILNSLDNDLKKLLLSWFDIGLLDLQEINWSSPAALLEKLISYEAVHAINSWSDLKNRLDSDRKCYAFFHYKMPDEPLIFVEVAFNDGLADNISYLLDENAPKIDPKTANSAIFYSISNAQRGLAGISFGNFLIKQVVEKLSLEFPSIKNFATLSPIPGFRKWLDPLLKAGQEDLFNEKEIKLISRFIEPNINKAKFLYEILQSNIKNSEFIKDLELILVRLCVKYLVTEKINGKAKDNVANFHLTNGAKIERINFLADVSKNGFQQSYGLMVNYYYQINEIEENHEAYLNKGKITTSRKIKDWLNE